MSAQKNKNVSGITEYKFIIRKLSLFPIKYPNTEYFFSENIVTSLKTVIIENIKITTAEILNKTGFIFKKYCFSLLHYNYLLHP